MATSLVRELLDAGIHFGHRCSRWNPQMAPYIYGKRNAIHIIDIRETLRGLLRAKKFLSRVVSEGKDVLFVGTKRQARDIVEKQTNACKMHYVTERWLGGSLTNFRTIRSRLQRLEELEKLMESPQWETGYSKKMKSTLTREYKKILRNLEGVRGMNRLPGAMVVIDVSKEKNAVREADALSIPTIGLVDTDSDPTDVAIPIPGNDDAMRSIEIVMKHLAEAVQHGMRGRPEPTETQRGERDREEGAGGPRRRGRRPTTTTRAQPSSRGAERAATESAVSVAEPPAAPEANPSEAPQPAPQVPQAPQAATPPESSNEENKPSDDPQSAG